jgi:hypothetical protein
MSSVGAHLALMWLRLTTSAKKRPFGLYQLQVLRVSFQVFFS